LYSFQRVISDIEQLTFNGTQPYALRVGGWSLAENVTGEVDENYAIQLDVTFDDCMHCNDGQLAYTVSIPGTWLVHIMECGLTYLGENCMHEYRLI